MVAHGCHEHRAQKLHKSSYMSIYGLIHVENNKYFVFITIHCNGPTRKWLKYGENKGTSFMVVITIETGLCSSIAEIVRLQNFHFVKFSTKKGLATLELLEEK